MGEILAGALMPHPPLLIPCVGRENIKEVGKTDESMKELSDFLVSLNPATIIILSPHGCHYYGEPSIIGLSHISGSMAAFGEPGCKLDFAINLPLTDKIIELTEKINLMLHRLDDKIVTQKHDGSLELDSGAFVPLYFLQQAGFKGDIVHICPGFISLKQTKELGEALKEAVRQCNGDVVLVGSGDLSHYLKDEPPYGFRPEGVEFDKKIIDAVKGNDLEQLLAMDEQFIERAGECGLRSLATLMSTLSEMVTEFYSYENTFGVGYAVASWEQPGKSLQTRKGHSLPVRLAWFVLEKTLCCAKDKITLPAWSDVLADQDGVFVSIKKAGNLRGCIGTFLPQYTSLQEEIYNNTKAAALSDPRFPPLTSAELAQIEISVDILSSPERVYGLDELDVKKYGVIVSHGHKKGLLLPDLEGVDSVEEQVHIAMQKAGIPADKEIDVYRFTVERYV